MGTAIAINIPALSSGSLYAHSPSNMSSSQSEVKRDLTEDLKTILTYTKHPNPQKLSPEDFAQKLGSPEFGPIEKFQVNGRDVVFRKTGYRDYIHAWFHPQGKTEILEIEVQYKDSLIQLLTNFPLIGVQSYHFDTLLDSWGEQVISLNHLSTVTIERVSNSRESPTESTITLTKKGFMDGSVNGKKIIIKLNRPDFRSDWEIINIQNLWICNLGRGSQAGSTKWCS